MDLQRVARHVSDYLSRTREAPVAVRVEPSAIRAHLRERFPFTAPQPDDVVFAEVTDMLWSWTEHAGNPRHMGLFRPGVDATCVAAEILVAGYDPNLATWDFAPAASEIERHVLAFMMARFGLDPEQGIAQFTSGGQESNHTAVIAALTQTFPAIASRGLRSIEGDPVFYLSAEGHHSFEKVAHATGLGRAALRTVAVDDRLRIDLGDLERQIARDRANGCVPFMVVGTAGTTSAGVVDPLPALAGIAERHGLWFHVDAAWGGAAAVSDRLRPLLAGIERADSISCDAHKWLSVPVAAGMFFCRRRGPLETAFATETNYVPEQSAGRTYPFITSLQWSRRFNGLKLFMLLAEHGQAGVAARVEHHAQIGEALRGRLRDAGFDVLNDTPLPVVCFTHRAIAGDAAAHERVCRELRDRQVAWISRTRLPGQVPALRACITHVETSADDVEALVRELGVIVA